MQTGSSICQDCPKQPNDLVVPKHRHHPVLQGLSTLGDQAQINGLALNLLRGTSNEKWEICRSAYRVRRYDPFQLSEKNVGVHA